MWAAINFSYYSLHSWQSGHWAVEKCFYLITYTVEDHCGFWQHWGTISQTHTTEGMGVTPSHCQGSCGFTQHQGMYKLKQNPWETYFHCLGYCKPRIKSCCIVIQTMDSSIWRPGYPSVMTLCLSPDLEQWQQLLHWQYFQNPCSLYSVGFKHVQAMPCIRSTTSSVQHAGMVRGMYCSVLKKKVWLLIWCRAKHQKIDTNTQVLYSKAAKEMWKI